MKLLCAALFMGSVFVTGCGKVENAVDCQTICDEYRNCFDSSYDVGACTSRCRDSSSRNSNFQRQVDECDACIGGRDCKSATFNCASDCANVVP